MRGMTRFLIRRLAVALCVAVTASFLTFALLRLAGDPAVSMAGDGASSADIDRVRKDNGLDRPLVVLYAEWISRAATGDFGRSFVMKQDVGDLIAQRAPVTAKLGVLALIVALSLAVPLGVVAGLASNSWADRVALGIATVGQAMPTFWLGLILILYVGLYWKLLPVSGNASLLHYVLPAFTLGFYAVPGLMRLTRAGVTEAAHSDYVRTAWAKGLRMPRIVLKHILRNAMIPVVALAAVQFGYMLGGSIVIEAIFSMNGLGQLAWQSIQRSDFAVMQAIVLVGVLVYIALTLLADLLNAMLDPRIRIV
jgi:peptide/nickel transport system permease protein